MTDQPSKNLQKSPLTHLLSGAISSSISCILFQPLDLLKTRQQQVNGRSNVLALYSKIIAEDGIKGLWRGLTPTLIRNVPGSSIYFMTLNSTKSLLSLWSIDQNYVNLISASLSRLIAGLIVMPPTVIKSRYESSLSKYSNYSSMSIFQVTKHIYWTEGFSGLFKGFYASVLRDVPASGLYFMFYEGIKARLSFIQQDTLRNVISSSSAGLVATLITQPFDILRTRVQLQETGYFKSISEIVQKDGIFGLWKGSTLRILRKVGSLTVSWVVYEEMLLILSK